MYFSASGNGRFIAEGISEICNDELVSLTPLMKSSPDGTLFESDKPFVFVLPIYAWRIPKYVDKFIRNSTFRGTGEVYVIVNCGGTPGNALKYIKKTCKYMGLTLKGFDAVNMPANYIMLYPTSPADSPNVEEALKYQKKQIESIANDINNGRKFFRRPASFRGKLQSAIGNVFFNNFLIGSKKFHINDKCIKCGECVTRCPLNNIVFINDYPHWENKCMHCTACINGCPVNAIEYGDKTELRNRYYLNKSFDEI